VVDYYSADENYSAFAVVVAIVEEGADVEFVDVAPCENYLCD